MNTIETRTITFIRNGKEKTMDVQVSHRGIGIAWIRKLDGKPFFGTTGYWNINRNQRDNEAVLRSYRGAVLAENVKGLEGIS